MQQYILVVDDDEHIAQLVQINLERAGYRVQTAPNGAAALDQVALEKPGLVILDVMMPQMSGFETLKKLKANPEVNHIPVIMLTVRSSETDTADAWKIGVDAYLYKPFEPSELLAFVKRFLPGLPQHC